jgi:predicted membrane protein
MKLSDTIILALIAVFLFIGIYETIRFGIGTAYWSIMLAVVLFFVYSYRKKPKK